MAVTLDDAREKLRWAKRRFGELWPQLADFEKRDKHTISCSVDADAGVYHFYVSGIEPIDPDWGLMIGDCLNNARSALDYLMVRLVALTTGQDVIEIRDGFPIAEIAEEFRVRKELRELPAFSGYLTRIEELQPFNARNPSIWGNTARLPLVMTVPDALRRLALLNNVDKHRVPQPVWLGAAMGFGHVPFVFPPEFKLRGMDDFTRPHPSSDDPADFFASLGPFEDGAEIGTLYFETPLAYAWEPAEVDMKKHFPLKVTFAENPGALQGVREQLAFCLWGVEATLNLFEPVFTHGTPPSPVTAGLRMKADLGPTSWGAITSVPEGRD